MSAVDSLGLKKKDKYNWWKEVVVYQVYPRSFLDTSNDGNGDLQGIIQKLDYIKSIGCDAIWISPFFKSPMIDNGYDISDFNAINPMFGTMKDFEQLIKEAKRRGIAIINDAVLNHCSDQHEWFKESKKSRDNKYADFFIWSDEKKHEDKLFSVFSDSPWTWVEERQQYYYHAFAVEQPDLNWANKEVRKALADSLNFWIKKGVKGFRFDVLDNWGKDIDKGIGSDGPALHGYIKELRQNSWKNNDLLTVAETWGANKDNALLYCGKDSNELSMIFHFEHIILSNRNSLKRKMSFDKGKLKECFYKWQELFNGDGWNSNFIQNHDLSRVVSAWGNDKEYWFHSATMLATVNHLFKGTPYIYQGEEIGMTNCNFELHEFNDVQTLEKYQEFVQDKKEVTHEQFLEAQNFHGRDNARTPMQWNSGKNAGFTNGEPWLKVNPNHNSINVEVQQSNERSILNFYRKLTNLRKNSEYKATVIEGDFKRNGVEASHVFSFSRVYIKGDKNKEQKPVVPQSIFDKKEEGEVLQKISVLANWSSKKTKLNNPIKGKCIISNYFKEGIVEVKELEPYEAIVLEVDINE